MVAFGARVGKDCQGRGTWKLNSDGNVLYLMALGLLGYVHLLKLKLHPKYLEFTVCKLYLND